MENVKFNSVEKLFLFKMVLVKNKQLRTNNNYPNFV